MKTPTVNAIEYLMSKTCESESNNSQLFELECSHSEEGGRTGVVTTARGSSRSWICRGRLFALEPPRASRAPHPDVFTAVPRADDKH
ncbi:hypothetical protein J6590_010015 [Homalodisca vitripennis]|nr:hypothetical protein J6590_010015 [Homalodisca vitripennis]